MDRTSFTLILGVLGGVLVVISAFIQYYDKKSSDKEAEDERQNALTFQMQLIASQNEVKELQNKSLEAAFETLDNIQTATSTLNTSIKIAKSTLANLTGGSAIPFLNLTTTLVQPIFQPSSLPEYYTLKFEIINPGEVPFYDVEFTITDAEILYIYSFADLYITSAGLISTSYRKKTIDEVSERLPSSVKSINRINSKSAEAVYVSAFPKEKKLSDYNNPGENHFYAINIKWIGGTMNVIINLSSSNNTVKLTTCDLHINGHKQEEISKFINFIHVQ